jgi:hypothetical protein
MALPKLKPLPKVSVVDDDAPALPTITVTVTDTERLTGIGRTKLYEEINAGRIEAVKAGSRTLILVASLRDYVAGLPRIRSGRQADTAA